MTERVEITEADRPIVINRVATDAIDTEYDFTTYTENDTGYEITSIDTIEAETAVVNSYIDDIEHIEAETAVSSSSVRRVGSINAETVFSGGTYRYLIVDEYIDGEDLDPGSYGGLVVAPEIDVDTYHDQAVVITQDDDDRFITYQGDWDELTTYLRDDPLRLRGIQAVKPEIDKIDDLAELESIEQEYHSYVEQASHNALVGTTDLLDTLQERAPQEVPAAVRSIGNNTKNYTRIMRFDESFQQLDEEQQQELITMAGTGDEPGMDTILNAVTANDHLYFEPDHTDELISLIETDTTVPPIPDLLDALYDAVFTDDSPYRDDETLRSDLASLYETYEQELARIAGLAEENGLSLFPYYDADTRPRLQHEQWLKQEEGRRQQTGETRSIDIEELATLMEDDIDDKQRSYLAQAIASIGEDQVPRWYEKATGTADIRAEDLSPDEREVLKAYVAHGPQNRLKRKHPKSGKMKVPEYAPPQNTEAAVTLLEQGDSVLEHPANQAWIQDHDVDIDSIYDQVKQYPVDQTIDGYEKIAAQAQGDLTDLTVRTADPLESIQMGNPFDSCVAVEHIQGSTALAVAADANKIPLYAETAGTLIGRRTMAITEDGTITAYDTYPDNDVIEDLFDRFLTELSTDTGRELDMGNGNITSIIADGSYYSMHFGKDGDELDPENREPFVDDHVRIKPAPGWEHDINIAGMLASVHRITEDRE